MSRHGTGQHHDDVSMSEKTHSDRKPRPEKWLHYPDMFSQSHGSDMPEMVGAWDGKTAIFDHPGISNTIPATEMAGDLDTADVITVSPDGLWTEVVYLVEDGNGELVTLIDDDDRSDTERLTFLHTLIILIQDTLLKDLRYTARKTHQVDVSADISHADVRWAIRGAVDENGEFHMLTYAGALTPPETPVRVLVTHILKAVIMLRADVEDAMADHGMM